LIYEHITEELAYPMISLLCDIGGTLGLLMGASVLTVCELLEVIWSYIIQSCCTLEERQPPSKASQIHPAKNKHDLSKSSLLLKSIQQCNDPNHDKKKNITVSSLSLYHQSNPGFIS
jgi:hypothetical protein